MALLPSPPPDATAALRGLVNTLAQTFEGQKTIRLATAANGERALTVGTSVADASVNEGFSMLSARVGIGGTEREFLKVRRPTSFGAAVMTIDQNSITNTRALILANAGAGLGGLQITNFGGGYVTLNTQQGGSPVQMYAENKGLEFSQNANSYDTTTLMRFLVAGPGSVATTIPAFDFSAVGALGVGQKLARWQANGSEVAALTSGGLMLNGYVNSLLSCSGSWIQLGVLPVRADSYFYSTSPTTAFYATANGGFSGAATFNAWSETADAAGEVATRLGTYVADASVNADTKLLSLATNMGGTPVEKLFVLKNGTIENTTAGAGIVLKSPDGTRWRFTISNAGAAVIALA